AAATSEERDKLRAARREFEDRRTEFEIAERKRLILEREQDLEKLKQASAAEIHAAEDAANRAQGGLKSDGKPIEWWNDAKGDAVSGTITRVDCSNGPLKVTIAKAGGGSIVLAVRDLKALSVRGAAEASFPCGAFKPAPKINVEHNA